MKNYIGGLFKDREAAQRARDALRKNEFDEASLHLLECTHGGEAVILKENPRIQSIAVAALIGGLILGTVGGILGWLVGLGIIQPPALEPSGGATLPFEITWQYTLTSLATGLIFGGVTGAILGVATRLYMAKYRHVNTQPATEKGDLMLTVEANDMRRETRARSLMKEHGAVRFEEFRESWDTNIWSEYDEEVQQTG